MMPPAGVVVAPFIVVGWGVPSAVATLSRAARRTRTAGSNPFRNPFHNPLDTLAIRP